MIYAGLIYFNDEQKQADEIKSAISSYTQTPPTIIKKNSLILCHGKISDKQDMDEVLENESSLLIGRTFDKTQEASIKNEDFKNLSSLNKEDVLEKIWGKYVYIRSNGRASQFDIVVDLTGQLHFFYYYFPNGNVLFASNIEIIFKVLHQKPKLNWTYLCSYLVYGTSSAIQTPFENIHELPPAC
jgi:asparagine synthase (glutamine-hydrolysing)